MQRHRLWGRFLVRGTTFCEDEKLDKLAKYNTLLLQKIPIDLRTTTSLGIPKKNLKAFKINIGAETCNHAKPTIK